MMLLAIALGCPHPKPTMCTVSKIENLERPGLHNSFRIGDRLYSGSEPEGDAGFASLKSLGIRTEGDSRLRSRNRDRRSWRRLTCFRPNPQLA